MAGRREVVLGVVLILSVIGVIAWTHWMYTAEPSYPAPSSTCPDCDEDMATVPSVMNIRLLNQAEIPNVSVINMVSVPSHGVGYHSWIADLNAVLPRVAYRQTIFFTGVKLSRSDEEKPVPFWPYVENWRRSIAHWHPALVPLIVCFDELTQDVLQRHLNGTVAYYLFIATAYRQHTGFAASVGADWKWFVAQQAIRMGYHAFHSDVDAVFLGDPFPLVETEPLADVYSISDSLDAEGWLRYANRSRLERQMNLDDQQLPECHSYLEAAYQCKPNYCAGASVWFVRARVQSLRYLADLTNLMLQQPHAVWEQAAQNIAIHRNRHRGLIFELFDLRQAANFILWNTAATKSLGHVFPVTDRVIWHPGYVGGDAKRDAMKKWGLWNVPQSTESMIAAQP